jgi:CBS domain containing-hemolysin-like protein
MPSIRNQLATGLLAALSVVVMLYSLIIAQQILLGIVGVGLVWFVYVLYRFVTILARIAASLERLVDQRVEHEQEQ